MRLQLGEKLTEFLTLFPDTVFARQLMSLEDIPKKAKLNYIEIEIENGNLKISYLLDSRPSDSSFTSTQRQTAKPITVFKKLLPDADLPQLNAWIDTLKAYFALPQHTLDIVKGNGLLDIYDESNYVIGERSILHQSCMRHYKCQPFIDFYVRNAVSGVCVSIGGKIAARALVWNATYNRKKVSVLDRIYAATDVIGSIIDGWSKSNCDYTIHHKTKYFRNNKKNTEESLDLYVGLQDIEGPYPYLDNFKYLMGKRLYTVYNPRTDIRVLQSTEGGASQTIYAINTYRPGYVWCLKEEKWLEKEKVVLLGNKYVQKIYTTPCGACTKIILKYDSRSVELNNTVISLCKEHYGTITIDNVQYLLCTAHAMLIPREEECKRCASEPKYCAGCKKYVRNFVKISNYYYCSDCTSSVNCNTCSVELHRYQTHSVYQTRHGFPTRFCLSCFELLEVCIDCGARKLLGCECVCAQDYVSCAECSIRVHIEDTYNFENDALYCYSCFRANAFECMHCGYERHIEERSEHRDTVCQNCYDLYMFECTTCGEHTANRGMEDNICYTCYTLRRYRCQMCNLLATIPTNQPNVCQNCYVEEANV